MASELASGAAARLAERRRVRRRRQIRHYATVLMFMAPWVIGFAAFVVYPIGASLYFSFTRYDLLSDPEWIGLDNFRHMFTSDPFFLKALGNTVWLMAVGLPLRMLGALLTAMLLMRPRRGIGIYRTLYYIPALTPYVAATLAFVFMLNPSYGPLNRALDAVGLPAPGWFYDPAWSKPGLVLLGLWGIGDWMIIYLAGLHNVPRQLYEAADTEGASALQKFRMITLPLITPVIFFTLVIGVIFGFQYFTEAYVAARASSPTAASLGAPLGSTLFYSVWIYEQGFQTFNMGYASALAWALFALVLVTTVVIAVTGRRWVYYQEGIR